MIRTLLVSLLTLGMLAASAVPRAETQRLVLVTSTPGITAADIDRETARRLFLGRAVVWDNQRITPIINHSEDLIYEVFLQNVIHMSANHYERHMLSTVFRLGGKRPRSVSDFGSLMEALNSRPATVTFMWESRARATPGVYIVTELWKGELR